MNTFAISSAETVLTQLKSPSKPRSRIVSPYTSICIFRSSLGTSVAPGRDHSVFSTSVVMFVLLLSRSCTGSRGRMKSSISAKRAGRSSSSQSDSLHTESIRALALRHCRVPSSITSSSQGSQKPSYHPSSKLWSRKKLPVSAQSQEAALAAPSNRVPLTASVRSSTGMPPSGILRKVSSGMCFAADSSQAVRSPSGSSK